MFGKLLKYDLKSMIKTVGPLWLVLLVLGIMAGLQLNIMLLFSNMALVILMIAIFVVTAFIVIMRFWNGLLKEEGYLMFTLPASARQLILSKFVSALIISTGSFFVMFLTGWIIMLLTGEESFNNGILSMSGYWVPGMNLVILCLFASLMAMIYKAYASMAIGHLSNHKRFVTIGAFIGLQLITSFVTSIMGEQVYNEAFMLVYYLIQIAIYHIIVEYILTKHLNLE